MAHFDSEYRRLDLSDSNTLTEYVDLAQKVASLTGQSINLSISPRALVGCDPNEVKTRSRKASQKRDRIYTQVDRAIDLWSRVEKLVYGLLFTKENPPSISKCRKEVLETIRRTFGDRTLRFAKDLVKTWEKLDSVKSNSSISSYQEGIRLKLKIARSHHSRNPKVGKEYKRPYFAIPLERYKAACFQRLIRREAILKKSPNVVIAASALFVINQIEKNTNDSCEILQAEEVKQVEKLNELFYLGSTPESEKEAPVKIQNSRFCVIAFYSDNAFDSTRESTRAFIVTGKPVIFVREPGVENDAEQTENNLRHELSHLVLSRFLSLTSGFIRKRTIYWAKDLMSRAEKLRNAATSASEKHRFERVIQNLRRDAKDKDYVEGWKDELLATFDKLARKGRELLDHNILHEQETFKVAISKNKREVAFVMHSEDSWVFNSTAKNDLLQMIRDVLGVEDGDVSLSQSDDMFFHHLESFSQATHFMCKTIGIAAEHSKEILRLSRLALLYFPVSQWKHAYYYMRWKIADAKSKELEAKKASLETA